MRTKKTTKPTTKPKADKHALQLGNKSEQPKNPASAIIQTVPNKYVSRGYVARFVTAEFTSLCPVTGQPDYATIVIDYVPASLLIESKSLKLFLGSFRNHGDFHEACVNEIADRLYEACEPLYMRVVGLFNARGGIAIDVVVEHSDHFPEARPDFMLPLPTVR